MTKTPQIPEYPMILIHCQNMGSYGYYIKDEIERAKSVKAPRDTYAAGQVWNGKDYEVKVHRWSDIKPAGMDGGEGNRERMARQCRERYGIDPSELIKDEFANWQELARGNIEANADWDENSTKDDIYDKAYTLALDKLLDSGAPQKTAINIAIETAMSFANP